MPYLSENQVMLEADTEHLDVNDETRDGEGLNQRENTGVVPVGKQNQR